MIWHSEWLKFKKLKENFLACLWVSLYIYIYLNGCRIVKFFFFCYSSWAHITNKKKKTFFIKCYFCNLIKKHFKRVVLCVISVNQIWLQMCKGYDVKSLYLMHKHTHIHIFKLTRYKHKWNKLFNSAHT